MSSKRTMKGGRHGSTSWASRREEVLRRDGYTCQRCGADLRADDQPAEVHHVTPVIEGGGDDGENLVSLCRPCHKDEHRPDRVGQLRRADDLSPGPVFTSRDVADHCDVAKGTASGWLRDLREEGVVEHRKAAGGVVYWFPN